NSVIPSWSAVFFFSSRRRHTRFSRDWSSDVCSSDLALSAIRANKMRSFLTMLGVIIGIAAVITMVALGEGAQQQVEGQLASLGRSEERRVGKECRSRGRRER